MLLYINESIQITGKHVILSLSNSSDVLNNFTYTSSGIFFWNLLVRMLTHCLLSMRKMLLLHILLLKIKLIIGVETKQAKDSTLYCYNIVLCQSQSCKEHQYKARLIVNSSLGSHIKLSVILTSLTKQTTF